MLPGHSRPVDQDALLAVAASMERAYECVDQLLLNHQEHRHGDQRDAQQPAGYQEIAEVGESESDQSALHRSAQNPLGFAHPEQAASATVSASPVQQQDHDDGENNRQHRQSCRGIMQSPA